MTATHKPLPDIFYLAIGQELEANPQGLKEYELIRLLRERGFFEFLPAPPAAPRYLFRAHFILFHALYQLRDRLLREHLGDLQIEALCILRIDYRENQQALTQADTLRAYYLDWSNLEETTENDIVEMIASFWNRLGSCARREQALAELGLTDPVDNDTIKQAWRRLAMVNHPDRGGDTGRLQTINAAVDCLLG